jgi:hypothetical protein
MNSHLNYLVAQERASDLVRGAEQARLAKSHRESESTAGRRGRSNRALAGLSILGARTERLRARRA